MKLTTIMEWAGASSVAVSAGMVDVRLGILAAGVWLIWAANFGDYGSDDDTDSQ